MSKILHAVGMNRATREGWAHLLPRARKARAWTQARLAEEASVALKTIGNMESGEMVPQADTIERLRDALGLSEKYFDAHQEVQHLEAVFIAGHDAELREDEESAQEIAIRSARLANFSSEDLLHELLRREQGVTPEQTEAVADEPRLRAVAEGGEGGPGEADAADAQAAAARAVQLAEIERMKRGKGG